MSLQIALLYMSHGERLHYEKVVIHLVTNLLGLIFLVQKLNYAADPLGLTYSTLVRCYYISNIYSDNGMVETNMAFP